MWIGDGLLSRGSEVYIASLPRLFDIDNLGLVASERGAVIDYPVACVYLCGLSCMVASSLVHRYLTWRVSPQLIAKATN